LSWKQRARARLHAIEEAGRRRSLRDFDGRGPWGRIDGMEVVSFASNDYLGFASHPAVVGAAHEALDRWGAGAGAARLIAGSRPVHRELEEAIADWKGAERALLFPTGYAANLGVLAALADETTLICSDELNHASIVDGCRLARAAVSVYPHNDVGSLERLLRDASRAVVVTESVFSMDGDVAPLGAITALCARHGALLVVDEAHAVMAPDLDLGGAEVVRVGTLSKFLGALGGFVAGPATIIELLVNSARPFIFTTAPSPADAGAALAAVRLLDTGEGQARVERLRELVQRVAPGHPSPIMPVVLGSEEAALAASRRLFDRGLLVPAIRPPSVPPGTSRLRVTLSAAHTDAHVDRLLASLAELEPAHA
jgi:8-amino-7-oxononanoate synthase